MQYNDFEKSIYKLLFDLYQSEEFHVEFTRNSYDGDFDALNEALHKLESGGILALIVDEKDELCAELDYHYCSKLCDL